MRPGAVYLAQGGTHPQTRHKLVVLDVDDHEHVWEPEDPPDVKAILDRFTEEHKSKGGDCHVGRKLLRIMKKAGFQNCTIEAFVLHSDEVGMDFLMPQIGPEIFIADLEAGKIRSTSLT